MNMKPANEHSSAILPVTAVVQKKDGVQRQIIPSLVDHCNAMEVLGRERNYSSSFLTLALDGGEWSASHPCRISPPGKRPLVPTG
jgi:hypothetical protein